MTPDEREHFYVVATALGSLRMADWALRAALPAPDVGDADGDVRAALQLTVEEAGW